MRLNNTGKDGIPNVDATMLHGMQKRGLRTQKQAPDEKESDLRDTSTMDVVEISQEANKKSNDMQSKLEEMRSRYKTLSEELERVREMSEGMAEAWKEKIRCLQIAMRIMSGHKVPEADCRYLMDKDPELYSKAITMRVERKDPEEYERLSEDDESKADGAAEDRPADASTSETSDVADVQAEPTEAVAEA